MILRAIKIRLYPNKTQEQTLNKVLGCYRFVYNQMLALKQESYNKDKTNLGLCELSKFFHGTLLKNSEYSWLKEQNTKVMKQAIRQMLSAYDGFFKLGKGFPKFKSKKDNQSALFPCEAISKSNSFETRHISLTKPLKNIKFHCSNLYLDRLQRYKNNIKSATLSKTKSGRFFLSILIEMNEEEFKQFRHTNNKVGIDLGVKDFIITSDGEVFKNKHFFKQSENKIKKLQRQLSKRVEGSNNRNKLRIKIAKAFEHLTNQRLDYIHNAANSLLRTYDYIFMENLNVQGMLKNHNLAKAIQELGFYTFKNVLKNKAMLNDKFVIEVDRWFASSKTCHKCGYVYKNLTLGEREWTCPICGEHLDRDLNAAMNILLEGERILRTKVSH
jgi:putative transposase